MSKILILLVAVFLAGVVCNEKIEKKEKLQEMLEGMRQKIDAVVNEALKNIFNTVFHVRQIVSKNIWKLKNRSKENREYIYDIFITINKTIEEVRKMEEKEKSAADECSELNLHFDEIEDIGMQALDAVHQCIQNLIIIADKYSKQVENNYYTLVINLYDMKKEAELCMKKANNSSSIDEAASCLNIVTSKATWAATERVPKFCEGAGDVAEKVKDLFDGSEVCIESEKVNKLIAYSNFITEKTSKCI